MLALTFVRLARPMAMGSSLWARWWMLAGMIRRPAAISSRTCSAGRAPGGPTRGSGRGPAANSGLPAAGFERRSSSGRAFPTHARSRTCGSAGSDGRDQVQRVCSQAAPTLSAATPRRSWSPASLGSGSRARPHARGSGEVGAYHARGRSQFSGSRAGAPGAPTGPGRAACERLASSGRAGAASTIWSPSTRTRGAQPAARLRRVVAGREPVLASVLEERPGLEATVGKPRLDRAVESARAEMRREPARSIRMEDLEGPGPVAPLDRAAQPDAALRVEDLDRALDPRVDITREDPCRAVGMDVPVGAWRGAGGHPSRRSRTRKPGRRARPHGRRARDRGRPSRASPRLGTGSRFR
jgi:hypothetical protein